MPVRLLLRRAGVDLVRYVPPSPEPEAPILGSYPPADNFLAVGRADSYFIHDGYQARERAEGFDDTGNTDLWQREVYQFAREIFDREQLRTVCDVGCGSAYKLKKYFAGQPVVGMDIPETCRWLRSQYPDGHWLDLDFDRPPALQSDLVIASDVIEHLPRPELLMEFIPKLGPRLIVLSTPDRNLLRHGTHDGPPRNPAHYREWSYVEFRAFVSSYFEVVDHFISNPAHSTQCVLCRPRL